MKEMSFNSMIFKKLMEMVILQVVEKIAGELVKALKEVDADVQKTFTIIPPQVLKTR